MLIEKAVLLISNDPSFQTKNRINQVYQELARVLHTTPWRIERNIRYTLRKTSKNTTNKAFIYKARAQIISAQSARPY